MIMPMLDVSDTDATIAFFTDKLGFNKDLVMPGPDGVNAFGIVSLGKASFGVGRGREGMPDKPGAGVEFFVYVPDETNLDDFYAQVKGRGVAITTEIHDEFWGDRVFSLKLPDGYHLTFAKTVREVPAEEIEAFMRSSD